MKIDGQNQAMDLLQRMQEANETGKTESASPSFQIERGNETTARVDGVEETALESRLKETASKALDGGFENAAEVRDAVIENIVDDQFDDLITKRTERNQLLDSLKKTLVDDPEFKKQVDDMLIMAARNVGADR